MATLVVLAGLRTGWRPQEDYLELGGFENRLRFPICKLIDKLSSEWRENYSLPVAPLSEPAFLTALNASGGH
ncbi:MAG: hypothetical protein ACQESR_16080 [Planctomycetota bacterium]